MDLYNDRITCHNCGKENSPGLLTCAACNYELTAEASRNDEDQPAGYIAFQLKDIAIGIAIIALYLLFSKIKYFPSNDYWELSSHLVLWSLFFICMFVFPICISKKRSTGPLFKPITIKSFSKELLLSVWFYALISLSIGIIVTIIEIVFHLEMAKDGLTHALKLAPNSNILIVIAVIGVAFGPIVEELFFRGFLYNALKSRFPNYIAALVQAIFFSLVHQEGILESIYIFLIGIALVIIYEKRKTLLSPVLVHMIFNSLVLIPALFLAIENHHIPARNWEEAATVPEWFKQNPIGEARQQDSGMKQWEYAINRWGSKGTMRWKKEAVAFNAVCVYFPDDKEDCAKARIGIVVIYLNHLKDYRRAIAESDKLISQFPEQREQVASALAYKGWAYYMLRDYEKSENAFNNVVSDYKDCKDSVESAREGLELIRAR